jgi:hypothetical protein
MGHLSGYEYAQRHLMQRERRRNRFILWIGVLVVLLFGALVGIGFCTLPLLIAIAPLAITEGMELYLLLQRSTPSTEAVEQGMAWLFGDDWRDLAEPQTYMIAQDRIRRQRMSRWRFYMHLIVYLPVNTLILYLMYTNLFRFNALPSGFELLVSLLWLGLLVRHGYSAFPSRKRRAQRERQFGQAIQFQIEQSTPETFKYKEKPKRDVRYTIGEDGELEQISEYLEVEKPKRDLL